MPELLIMRHGKSDWHQDRPDFDRPLNRRGERDARAMGEWLAGQSPRPARILASPARRARQTAEAVAAALALPPAALACRDALYLADRATLLRELSPALAESDTPLLLVGHNPGLDELVAWLAPSPPPRTAGGKLMTTAAIAAFSLPAVDPLVAGVGRLRFLVRPKELLRES